MNVKHYKSYCKLCKVQIVICGTCGNNTCNGGHGTINGKECPDCESAYDIFLSENLNKINELEEFKDVR